MIVTTTNSIEGKKVIKYLGIVTGEAIIGANFIKYFFVSVRDIVGGRVGSYEEGLREAKNIAMAEMQDYAAKLGANAILGIDLYYETMGSAGSMLVSASGTSIIVEH